LFIFIFKSLALPRTSDEETKVAQLMVEKSRRNGTQPNLSFSTRSTSTGYCTHDL